MFPPRQLSEVVWVKCEVVVQIKHGIYYITNPSSRTLVYEIYSFNMGLVRKFQEVPIAGMIYMPVCTVY